MGGPLYLCECIICLAAEFDLSVTSWIRSKKRNAAKGGSEDSSHTNACAVDIVLDNTSDISAFTKKAERLGLYVFKESDHLHVRLKYQF